MDARILLENGMDFVAPKKKELLLLLLWLVRGWLVDEQKWDFFMIAQFLRLQNATTFFKGKIKMCLMLHYQHFQNAQSISKCNVHSVPWWKVSDLAVVLATCPPRRSRKKTARGGGCEFLDCCLLGNAFVSLWCPEKNTKRGWIHDSSPNLMMGGFQSCWGFQGRVTKLRSGERIFPVLIARLLGKAAIFGKGLT